MNLYELRDRLRGVRRAVFTVPDIARITGSGKRVASVYVNRMLGKRLLFRIERGKVSTTDDPFIAASQLADPAYISLASALYLHGRLDQVIDKMYLLSSRRRGTVNVFGMDALFVHASPKMMFGYRKVEKGGSYIMLADLEKAILDCLCCLRYCRMSSVLDAIEHADRGKLEDYARAIGGEAVTRRLGYLLDGLGIRHSFNRSTNIVHKLNPSIEKKGTFDPRWYLYVNEDPWRGR